MARSLKTDNIGMVAIIVSPMLVMGALMFLLVTLLANVPRIILIPPLVQIALGFLTAAAGFFLRRGYERAGWILVFIGIALVVNMVAVVVLFATMR
jgi:hypothetical protein